MSPMENFGYVYRITNLTNGKTYIGQRCLSRDSSWDEYYGSGLLIKQAIAKYGKSNFSKTLITYADSRETLNDFEASAISEEWIAGHGEYNLRIHVPSPDSWVGLPTRRVEEIVAKRANSLRISSLKDPKANPSHIAAEARWFNFLAEIDESSLTNAYGELRSVARVAESMGVSRVHVSRYLRENNLLLPSRTVSGRRASDLERSAIANGLLRNIHGEACGICSDTETDILCKKHRADAIDEAKAEKSKVAIDAFKKLGSLRAASRDTGMTTRKIKGYLIAAGIEVPKQSTDAARAAKQRN